MTLVSRHRSEIDMDHSTLVDALESLTRYGFIGGFSVTDDIINVDCDYKHTGETVDDREWITQSGRATKPNDHRYNDPLVRHWYKVLKDSGFNDIEHRRELSSIVKINEQSVSYYHKASQFLHTNKWVSHRDQTIFEKHCDGLSVRRIASETGVCPNTVQNVINRYREQMNQG